MNFHNSKALVAVISIVLLTSAAACASELDQRIMESAKSSYVFKTYFTDDSIQVESNDGAVILTGTVAEESHKSLAQETVASLPGVVSVDNQLEFKGDKPTEGSDGWISMQVKYSLLYNRHVSGIKTQVFVNDGIVTLKGEAQNQAQKDLATEYAKDVTNVKDVKNEMTVAQESRSIYAKKPVVSEQTMGEKIDDASITAQVKMALLFHRSTSAFKTGVKARDGVVTLSGKANSGAAKDMAGKVANNVNGVITVINNITIEDPLSKK